MEGKRKISREKGVEICGDRMYSGIKPKEIIRELGEKYGVSTSTVEKWMKAARPIVLSRQAAANAIKERVDKEETEASAKRLHITKERLMEELAKVAFYDPRRMYTVDGGLKGVHEWDDEVAGAVGTIESFDVKTDIREGDEVVDSVTTGTNRKVKTWDKIRAIEALNKMMGYNAPEKKEATVKVQNLNDEPLIFD